MLVKILVLVLWFVSDHRTVSAVQSDQIIMHSDAVRDRGPIVSRPQMVNQEDGLRGPLTGDETFLEPYRRGRRALTRSLRGITATNRPDRVLWFDTAGDHSRSPQWQAMAKVELEGSAESKCDEAMRLAEIVGTISSIPFRAATSRLSHRVDVERAQQWRHKRPYVSLVPGDPQWDRVQIAVAVPLLARRS